MIAAVIKENFPGEKRVALIPRNVAALTQGGLNVTVESGAGSASLHPDSEYEKAGARIETDRGALLSETDLVLAVRGPGAFADFPSEELDRLKRGAILIGFLEPLAEPETMQALASRGVTAFAMELVPRITRAQTMDALSSMASIAGYEAVLLGAEHSPKMFPMQITAAGTITPAKVFVLGAGVAGLQAIATARRLGALVEAYDIRPVVKEQVESLGARFVELEIETEQEGQGGYAAAQSEEFHRRQRELLAERLASVDVVITTAAVPGKRAPILITTDMTEQLRPGAVVVDLAAEKGGNCKLTRAGETVVYRSVTISGPINLPSQAAYHASQMYSNNIATFVELLIKDGDLTLGLEDEIIKGTLVTHQGRVVHPAVLKVLRQGD